MAAPVKVAKQQTTPELSGTFRTLPPEPTPTRAELFGTLQNPPENSEPCLRNLYTNTGRLQNPPEPSETFRNQPFGTFRNPPPEPTPAYTATLQNLPEFASHRQEPSGTFRNLLEPSRTFLRNLLLRLAPAHTGAYLG